MTKSQAALLLATACLFACSGAIDDSVDAGPIRQCHTVAVDRCSAAPTVPYDTSHYESCTEPAAGECLTYCIECAP